MKSKGQQELDEYIFTRPEMAKLEAMMRDYQNKTCVGNYLRESQQQAAD